MTHTLKVRSIGSSRGIIIPRGVLERMNLEKGDALYLAEDADGYRLVAHDPGFAKAMASYRKIARRYRNTFRELAQ